MNLYSLIRHFSDLFIKSDKIRVFNDEQKTSFSGTNMNFISSPYFLNTNIARNRKTYAKALQNLKKLKKALLKYVQAL